MREIAGLQTSEEGPVLDAIRHHLESGGGRTRAMIAIGAGTALQLHLRDTIAIAAAAELLHNASLIHDDLQDQADERRGETAVWMKFGTDIAICAGDLLLSSAYAALATTSDPLKVASLVQVTHGATARVINGQAQDLALQDRHVDEFDTYSYVAGEKSGPLLSLPVELVLTAAGLTDYVDVAREAATSLAIAYQIADDLEDEQFDTREGVPGCLNAVDVLRRAKYQSPRRVARYKALLALGDALRLAMRLPSGSGESVLRCIEAVNTKLEAAAA